MGHGARRPRGVPAPVHPSAILTDPGPLDSLEGSIVPRAAGAAPQPDHAMKPGIHPEYRPVVFRDASNGQAFLTRSTIHTDKTIKWEDGNEYPLYTLEISAASHPFYTGTQRMLDTAGRVERFAQRYSSLGKSEDAPAKTPAKKATSKATPKAKKATGK